MTDDPDPSFCIGDHGPLSLGSLARFALDANTFRALYDAKERFDLESREHILARITPRELVFIEHVCLHPEDTDEEIMNALGLRERTVQAYYTHFSRNFNVRNSSELRRWASKNHLVRMPDADPEVDLPDDQSNDGPKDPPDEGFDPWVRWY
jgi:DNA-binding CsgD family transcriptional regulator